MGTVRTMEDFIRQRLTVDGGKRLTVGRRPDGKFEASWVHRDGKTATVEVDDDPATALWNSMVPYTLRRRLPSGRDVVIEGAVLGLDAGPVKSAGPADDLDDLFGAAAPPSPPAGDDDLEDLFG